MRVLVPILLGFLVPLVAGEHWPQFRGPQSTGIAEDPTLPDTWNTTRSVVWKAEIPGSGWSSPVVWGDRIFVPSVISSVAPEAPKKGLYFGGNREGIPSDEHRWMVYA